MARLSARGAVLVLDGIDDLIRRAEAERLYRKSLRKAMRAGGKVMKAEYISRARAVSRRLARRVRVKVKQGPGPGFLPVEVKVIPSYAGGPTLVSGRRPGAKMPPLAAIRGGYPAARAIAQRGLPGHPFVPGVVAAVRPQVERLLGGVGEDMVTAWRS